ncbi:MAG: response regulator [Vicinamibacterales bacterium]
MLTQSVSTTSRMANATQRVLIVNGSHDILEMLEPLLDAGNYDVIFVESSGHAYSQIKRVQPDLVILCIRMDDAEGLSVLSMLKLDAETRDIPVVTYTTPPDEETADEDDEDDEPFFSGAPAARLMN